MQPLPIAILATGSYAAESTAALGDLLAAVLNAPLLITEPAPADRHALAARLRALADAEDCSHPVAMILVVGGIGFAPTDITPEATRDVLEKEAPGLAEAMRRAAFQHSAQALLSRAVCGIRRRTLILNLPGDPRAAVECLRVILPILPEAIAALQEAPEIAALYHTYRA